MAKSTGLMAAALAAAWALFTCGAQRTAAAATLLRQEKSPEASSLGMPAATNKAGARLVTDETGRRMMIPVNVERVVTLAPNLTETIYALGLQDKLAADTTYCDIPPAAKDKPHVGGPQSPSLEAIVAMHPDLVLATTSINRAETADALLKLGIPVYTSAPHTVSGMLSSTAEIADLIGAKDQGAKLVADLQKRLDTLHTLLQDRPMVHVLFVVWEDPLISIGQNTFIADALRWAGAESVITSDQNWPQVSMEEVVRLQPDYITLTADHLKAEDATKSNDLRTRPTWRDLQAVKWGHVVVASDEIDRPSPGMIGAIEQLAHDFHPEVFGARGMGATGYLPNRIARAGLRPVTTTADSAPTFALFARAERPREVRACAR